MRESTKTKNAIGIAYEKAEKPEKFYFTKALMDAAGNDKWNYLKLFRDTWQYEQAIGRVPFAIVKAAETHLDFSIHPQLSGA